MHVRHVQNNVDYDKRSAIFCDYLLTVIVVST